MDDLRSLYSPFEKQQRSVFRFVICESTEYTVVGSIYVLRSKGYRRSSYVEGVGDGGVGLDGLSAH